MSDLKEILKRIHEEQKVEEILEKLGCPLIQEEQNGKLYTAMLPDGDNKRSIQIYCDDENLNSFVRTRGISGNLYDIIGYIKFNTTNGEELKTKLYDIKKWICIELGWPEYLNGQYKPKKDYLDWLKKIRKGRNNKYEQRFNKPIDESILEQYVPLPHKAWIKEGISPKTQMLFEVGYDLQSERIVFPLRNKHGQLVGVKGRYVGTEDSEQKYLYLHPCNGGLELFNFHRAMPYVEKRKEIIVVEGEKSCMFLTQWGYKNCVAIGGSDLSLYQVEMLKDLGMDVSVVFAWDKGIIKDNDESKSKRRREKEFILGQLEKFNLLDLRKIFVVYDNDNLLEDKDSPVDKGKDVWENLYKNNKYKINNLGNKSKNYVN